MSPAVEKVVFALISTVIMALGGWVYATGNRVTAVETRVDGEQKTISEIHEDVRELRRVLIGPRTP